MKITRVETFILHVPVTRSRIEDSTHRLTHWGAPGVIIHSDTGLRGYGYTGTHADLATDRLITGCIADTYGHLLAGEDPLATNYLWDRLFHHPPAQWVGRCGITQLALAAVDVGLWDLKAKAAGLPLWALLGGGPKRLRAYNTDGGWLNWPVDVLADDCRRLVEEGYHGVKVKVGSADWRQDLERVARVRTAIGPGPKLMVDANGRWDLPTAAAFGRRLCDYEVEWFEEPLWYDDIEAHAALARRIATPIALGEQLYGLDPFRDFIRAGAVGYVQPDAVRVAGVTEWWRVADLALAHHLPVVAHIGDMMQVHVHLSIAHPACALLEYIPWMRDCFEEPATVADGVFAIPEQPGAGTTLRTGALEKYGIRP